MDILFVQHFFYLMHTTKTANYYSLFERKCMGPLEEKIGFHSESEGEWEGRGGVRMKELWEGIIKSLTGTGLRVIKSDKPHFLT